MPRLLRSILLSAALSFAAGVQAAPIIELSDGSRIQGDIQSLEGGVYTIVSPALGTLRIAQSKIARINYDAGADRPGQTSGSADAMAAQISQLQTQLAKDPATMSLIMQLQQEPQIQALLNDPKIMRAIEQGDYSSLMNDPQIQALGENAQIKQLLQQVQ